LVLVYSLYHLYLTVTPTNVTYTLSLHDALPIWNLGWVICQGQLVHFLDPGAVSLHILLHGYGVVTGTLLRFSGQSRDRCRQEQGDRKSTRLNSSHVSISYAVFCLKKKTEKKSNK